MVRPAVTYGSLIWAPYLKQRHRDKLNKLQRLALVRVGHVRKSTPGPGMEVITGQLPLDLHILSTALRARVRLGEKIKQDWKGKNLRN